LLKNKRNNLICLAGGQQKGIFANNPKEFKEILTHYVLKLREAKAESDSFFNQELQTKLMEIPLTYFKEDDFDNYFDNIVNKVVDAVVILKQPVLTNT
jgi:hypothetical protein